MSNHSVFSVLREWNSNKAVGFVSCLIQDGGKFAMSQAYRIAKSHKGTGWAGHLANTLYQKIRQKYNGVSYFNYYLRLLP